MEQTRALKSSSELPLAPSGDALANAIVVHSDDAIISKTLDGTVLSWNAGAEALFGYNADEMLGMPITDLFPADRLNEESGLISQLRAGHKISHFTTQRIRKDGAVIDVSVTLSPIRNELGAIVAVSKIARNITMQQRLQREHDLAAAIVEQSNDAIIAKTADGTILTWNFGAERIFGYTADEMIGQTIVRLFPADRLQEEQRLIDQLNSGKNVDQFETKRVRKDGHVIDVSLTLSPVRGKDGKIVVVSKIARDITERTQMQARLEEMRWDLHQILEHSPAMVSLWNGDRTLRYANKAYAEVHGYNQESIRGRHVAEVLGTELYAQTKHLIDKALLGEAISFEREVALAGGAVRHELVNYVRDAEKDGDPGLFVFVTDITRRKNAEREVEESAASYRNLHHHDGLTGLPNRILLADRMEQALAMAQRHGHVTAVCYVDLDGFKQVNDQFGHASGDRLLVEIAGRLLGLLRRDDTAARLGGDEFVLLLTHMSSEEDYKVAMERVVAEISLPVVLDDGTTVHVSASVGVALSPKHGANAVELMRRADAAMYASKKLGRSRISLFRSEEPEGEAAGSSTLS